MARAKDPMAITRPIRIKRDFEGARTVVKKLSAAPQRDTTAELRLQTLLAEMDRFESENDDADDEFVDASMYGGPRRRWSDEAGDA